MMPGIPCIYYGDELGMMGEKDPLNRGCFEHEKRDQEIFRHYKRLLSFRQEVETFESLELLKFEHGMITDNMYSFHRKGQKCRLHVAVNAGDEWETLPLNLRDGEKIIDYFISGDVSFADLDTFHLKGCSGIAVLIGE